MGGFRPGGEKRPGGGLPGFRQCGCPPGLATGLPLAQPVARRTHAGGGGVPRRPGPQCAADPGHGPLARRADAAGQRSGDPPLSPGRASHGRAGGGGPDPGPGLPGTGDPLHAAALWPALRPGAGGGGHPGPGFRGRSEPGGAAPEKCRQSPERLAGDAPALPHAVFPAPAGQRTGLSAPGPGKGGRKQAGAGNPGGVAAGAAAGRGPGGAPQPGPGQPGHLPAGAEPAGQRGTGQGRPVRRYRRAGAGQRRVRQPFRFPAGHGPYHPQPGGPAAPVGQRAGTEPGSGLRHRCGKPHPAGEPGLRRRHRLHPGRGAGADAPFPPVRPPRPGVLRQSVAQPERDRPLAGGNLGPGQGWPHPSPVGRHQRRGRCCRDSQQLHRHLLRPHGAQGGPGPHPVPGPARSSHRPAQPHATIPSAIPSATS